MKIAIIDYGSGNLRSVSKAIEHVGGECLVTASPRDVEAAEKIILPGVGAFGDCMRELENRRLIKPILNHIKKGKIFLGLCLGIQLLFEASEESPKTKGLAVFKGKVRRFRLEGLKVPHMGWNQIKVRASAPGRSLFAGVPDQPYMYFVHSYHAEPADQSIVSATTNYGIEFASAVTKNNIYALQFHPEKSQELGLQILRNFVNF